MHFPKMEHFDYFQLSEPVCKVQRCDSKEQDAPRRAVILRTESWS